MATSGPSPAPLQPGDLAPDFSLPAVHHEGSVSLADYRGEKPVLLALMRGFYCAFCRRHIQQLGTTAEKLQTLGVETLAIVASNADRARMYNRYRPAQIPLAADPELMTHRAYGVPNRAMTPEISQVIESKYADLAHELRVAPADITQVLDQRDGFQPLATDAAEMQRHQVQLVGQFLVDQNGIIRWVNIEGAREGLAGLDSFPTDTEFLAAAKSLRE
jgi:peroxiredoxin